VTALVGAFAWPALVLFIVLRFRTPIGDFLKNLGEFSVKAPGIEATARRQEITAAVAIGAALTKSSPGESALTDPAEVANELVAALPGARGQRDLSVAVALWVDDRLDNNRYERAALEALGLRFKLARSTQEALEQLDQYSFDLVISDMSRPPDPTAGYMLLDAMKSRSIRLPFIIYAGSKTAEYVREARRRGAVGYTNSPQELIEGYSELIA
jgi:CheY-like chemotaxis protein